MTLFEWARVWVDHESIATVAKLHFAEAVWCRSIVDKNVVRFDIYTSIRLGARIRPGALYNTCVHISAAM
jgi:hypothetical protein